MKHYDFDIWGYHKLSEPFLSDDLNKDIKEANCIQQSILKNLKKNETFIDTEFPHNNQSIGKIIYSQPNSANLNIPVQWLRPNSLRGDEYSSDSIPWSVTRNPSCEDIVQGRLGNCWFLTGLSLIADRMDLLNQILITKETNRYGLYQIRLCKDGKWTVITIDDYFPANVFNQMVYSRANRKQLWVSLIEKAAAKLYGSYEALSLGFCAVGLSILTGYPCETIIMSDLLNYIPSENRSQNDSGNASDSIKFIRLEDEEEKDTVDTIWAKLLSAKDANFVMCTSCGHQNEDENFRSTLKKLGLCNLHAYAILDVRDIPEVGVRLIRLKNPWSRISWKGDWCNEDPKWNNLPRHLRDELHPVDASGDSFGVFWISFNDIMRYFLSIDICQCFTNELGWQEIRMHSYLPLPMWVNLSDRHMNDSPDISKQLTKVTSIVPISRNKGNGKLPDNSIEFSENTCAVITVMEPSMLHFVLWQSTDRLAGIKKPVDLLIVVVKGYRSKHVQIIASSSRQVTNYVVCDKFLDPGIYTVFYFSFHHWCENKLINFNDSIPHSQFQSMNISNQSSDNIPFIPPDISAFECCLCVHSSQPVLLQSAPLAPIMIPLVMLELVINKGRLQIFNELRIYSIMKKFVGLILVVVNPISGKMYRCNSDCFGSTNMLNSRGNPKQCVSMDDIINPGYAQITTLLTQDDSFSSYKIQHQHSIIGQAIIQSNHNAQNSSFQTENTFNKIKQLFINDYPTLKYIAPGTTNWPPIRLILHLPLNLSLTTIINSP